MKISLHSRFMTAMLGGTLLLLLAAPGCGPDGKGPAENDSTAQRVLTIGPENYAVAIQERIETGPAISGTLVPREQATVRAQISGAVLGAYANQGQRVSRGTLLARLDDRAIGDAVTSARASVNNAESALRVAERDEARQVTLLEAGAISQRDVENARRNTIAARAALAQARSQLVAAQKQLAFTRVAAPISGVISEKLANTGDIVQPGGALFTVVDPSSMQLEALIPAEQLQAVRAGSPVEFRVTGYPDRVFNGTITRINPSADPATRQVRIYAEIPNSGGTLVGELFAQGRVASQTKTTLTVPGAAIDRRSMQPAALRLNGGKVEKVRVTLGLIDEQSDRVEIVSGIRAGDTVLVGAALQITPGTVVRATPASQSTAGQGPAQTSTPR